MDIIMNNKKIHDYRLKFAFEPDEKELKKINDVLAKYDVVSTEALKRTIFQSKPVDFYNLDCGEIWIMDVGLAQGIQHDIVHGELSSALGKSKALIIVSNKNVPTSTYDTDDLDFDKVYEPKLLDPNYSDAHETPKDIAGEALKDKVIKACVDDYNKDRTPYSEYMAAGFNPYGTK